MQIIKCAQNSCAGRCIYKEWSSILGERLFDASNQIVDAHASVCICFDTNQIVRANAQPMYGFSNAVMWFLRCERNQWLLTELAGLFYRRHSTISCQNHTIPAYCGDIRFVNCYLVSSAAKCAITNSLHVWYWAARCEYSVTIIVSKQIAKCLYHFVFHQCEYGSHFKCVSVSSANNKNCSSWICGMRVWVRNTHTHTRTLVHGIHWMIVHINGSISSGSVCVCVWK